MGSPALSATRDRRKTQKRTQIRACVNREALKAVPASMAAAGPLTPIDGKCSSMQLAGVHWMHVGE